MRILKYELYKLLSKKFLLLLALVLFISNCYLYINEQINKDVLPSKVYDSAIQEYSGLPAKDALSKINKSYNELNVLSVIINLRSSKVAEEAIKQQVSPILDLWANSISYEALLKKYDNSKYMKDNSYLQDYLTSIGLINSQLEYIVSYPDFINSMEHKAENMQSVSIFNKEGTYAYRNIIKTPNDFKNLKGIKLKLDYDRGIVSSTQYKFTDLSMAAIIFLLCVYIFLNEKESGLIKLTKAAKNGHMPVILSKLAVLSFTTTAFSVVFYGSILFLGNMFYGFGDLSRYVQSISSFRDCCFLLSVKEYICIFILTKIIITMLTSLVFAVIFNIFSKPKVIYVILALFTGLSYFGYTFIHPASYINTLKYLNFFAFFNVFSFYGEYTNINFLGFPINKVYASIFVFLVLVVITVSITIISYIRNYTSSGSILYNLLNRFTVKRTRLNGSTNLFLHESYKIFISNKTVLIIIVALIIGYQNIQTSPFLMTKDTAVYKSYVDSLTGEVTAEKEKFIQNEQKQFDNIPLELQNLRNSLNNGLIKKEAYTKEVNRITFFSEKQKGFERLKKQYEYLVDLKNEKGINGSFICELSSRYLFSNRTRDLYNGLLYCILLILCLSNIFPIDYKNGMLKVYKCTLNGRIKLFAYKNIIAIVTSLLLLIIVNLPFYINLLMRYDIKSWSAPIQSISVFKNLDFTTSILDFVVLVNLLQFIGCIVIANLIVLISLFVKKHSICTLISTVILGFPPIMSLIGISSIDFYSLNNIFVLFSSLSKSKTIISTIVYYIFLMVLLVLSALLGAKIYTGNVLGNVRIFKVIKHLFNLKTKNPKGI